MWRKFGFHLERGQERGRALRTDAGQWMGTVRSRFSPESSCSVECSVEQGDVFSIFVFGSGN